MSDKPEIPPLNLKFVEEREEENVENKGRFARWIAWWNALQKYPIVIFYQYLWEHNKTLFIRGVFVSYLLPLVLEMMPWIWLSTRKLGNKLRKQQIGINYNMQTGGNLQARVLLDYLGLMAVYAFLDTFLRYLRGRVSLENRLVIRRLVFERLLYSEIGAFEKLPNASDIEWRISTDINQTLNFVTVTLPQIIGSIYAFLREGFQLYQQKDQVDPLAFAYPIAIAVFRKIAGYVQYHTIEKHKKTEIDKGRKKMSKLVSHSLEGLAEIQVNNLQQHQLKLLDKLIGRELINSKGYLSLFARTWDSFAHRNVLEFVAEVFVVHTVMKRRSIDYKRYSKIQYDINRVLQLARKVVNLLRTTAHIRQFQQDVVELINIPNFLTEECPETISFEFKSEGDKDEDGETSEEEEQITEVDRIKQIKVKDLEFSYFPEDPSYPPALSCNGTLTFQAGKTYALVGLNRCGKSTLCKLLCKLYLPQKGTITVNGYDCSHISRVALRKRMSYVSQKPFLFPGTIRDNIRIGNPEATEEEIYEAAHAAGVFAYGFDGGEGTQDVAVAALGMRRSISMIDMRAAAEGDEHTDDSQGGSTTPPNTARPQHRRQKSIETAFESHPTGETTSSTPSLSPRSSHSDPSSSSASIEPTAPSPSWFSRIFNWVWEAETDFHGLQGKKKKKKKMHLGGPNLSSSGPPSMNSKKGKQLNSVLDLKLQSGATNISGGFAQSVALARVFVKTDASVIILDEALDQMDAYKKREIIFPRLEAFAKKWDMLLIMITHNIASVENVDTIFVMHEGSVVHQGSHQQLVANNAEVYMKLLGIPPPGQEGQRRRTSTWGSDAARDGAAEKGITKDGSRLKGMFRPVQEEFETSKHGKNKEI